MEFKIRKFHPTDMPYLYEICLKTGDSGKDASSLFKNPYLLGHFYAASYSVFEPNLTLILTLENLPVGYILGTSDSEKFSQFCEEKWLPILREQFPLPDENDLSRDANIIRILHKGYFAKPELAEYPAHLHIDILPIVQGKGLGGKLISEFRNELKLIGINAFHLEVGKKNLPAIQFYEKQGFHLIKEYEYSIAYGMYV